MDLGARAATTAGAGWVEGVGELRSDPCSRFADSGQGDIISRGEPEVSEQAEARNKGRVARGQREQSDRMLKFRIPRRCEDLSNPRRHHTLGVRKGLTDGGYTVRPMPHLPSERPNFRAFGLRPRCDENPG